MLVLGMHSNTASCRFFRKVTILTCWGPWWVGLERRQSTVHLVKQTVALLLLSHYHCFYSLWLWESRQQGTAKVDSSVSTPTPSFFYPNLTTYTVLLVHSQGTNPCLMPLFRILSDNKDSPW